MKLIGDPHLGREFLANVPLDRRGDREKMMFVEFGKQINESNDTTVIVGDLFERPIVRLHCLFQTLEIIIAAATIRPNRKIIILAGNHDLDKATDKRGSFHLLSVALERVPNVYVLFKPIIIEDTAFFPWQYEFDAIEQVEQLASDMRLYSPWRAIGHWDLASFGDDTSHLCPAKELTELGITKIYSGHWHLSGVYDVGGFTVICTGSMQPMSHAEDPKGELYVTLSKEEYEKCDPNYLNNRYIRVRTEQGEEVTPPATCLGFKVEYTTTTREVERVNLGTFDLNDIINQAFKSFEVPKDAQSFVKGKLNAIS